MRCVSRCRLHSYSLSLPRAEGDRSTRRRDHHDRNAAIGNTLATFTVPQAGSAAGLLFSAVPPSPTYLNEDDVVVLTPSGASGAAVPMYFSLSVRTA
jgi:hypothetical protein